MKFDISGFFQNLSRKLKFHYNVKRLTGILREGQRTLREGQRTLREGQRTFMIITGLILVTKRNFSEKGVQ